MPQMIIANRLVDGVVVFLAPRDDWSTAIADGAVIGDDAEAQRLLGIAKQHEARCLVIDPTLIAVTVENGQPKPTEIREAIRAFGPTVRTDLTDVDQPVLDRGAGSDVRGSRARKNTKG
jgi:Protein of unknown function (DUF2849)